MASSDVRRLFIPTGPGPRWGALAFLLWSLGILGLMTFDYGFRDIWNAEAAAKQRAPATRSLSLAIERPGTYWVSLEYRSDLARSARLDTFIDQEPSRPGAIRVVPNAGRPPEIKRERQGRDYWMSDEQGNWRGTTAARLDLTPGTYRVSTTLREQGVRIAWGPQPDQLKGRAPLFWTIGLSGSGALIGAWGVIARRRAARLIAGN
ncbi:hypothetical protein [Streptomyces sp. NBC_00690]|uniref:hypothetical protein n=1 Tax=Streptomyces sp. NBC_00690 TaxID=2975808 RepID=UPI002E28B08E|nr:hypothetical protein [Streptomyces sp. NBC_00690]